MKKVLAFGTFDTIHPGHIFFLREAKKLGSHLTIVVARDVTVHTVKKHHPHHREQTRLRNIRKLGIADRVILGSLNNKYEVVSHVAPQVVALGYDQKVFVAGLRKAVPAGTTIVRIGSYHPHVYKTSKLAPVPGKVRRFVTVLGVLVKNKQMLLLKRKDPRPDFNGLWEFPGGGLEAGESEEQALHREVFEESGFTIKILYEFPHLYRAVRPAVGRFSGFEVFLKVYICKPTRGVLKLSPSESTDWRWCGLQEARGVRTFDLNKKILKQEDKIFSRYIRN